MERRKTNRLLIVIVAALAAFLITSLALASNLESEAMPGQAKPVRYTPFARRDDPCFTAIGRDQSSKLRGSARCPEQPPIMGEDQ